MISLAKSLRVKRGDVVSFVGGGGKTTSMFRLAAELSASGMRVVSTTTTHISEAQVLLAPAAIKLEEMDLLGPHLDRHGQCLLIGQPDGKGRVFGASAEQIALLIARPDVDVVLVEADGSRSLPFKAPGGHEPVVPPATTILSPIAAMIAIGQPLDESHVHRAALAAALARQPVGSAVTPQTLARVLSHPEGGAKLRPAGARLVPILNKADAEIAFLHAGEAAEFMLAESSVDSVLISTMNQIPPVRESWTHVAGIVLAAGKSTRFGNPKQLLPWKDTTFVVNTVRVALAAGLDPVVVVLGHQAERIEKLLTGLPARTVLNPDYEAGQSASLRKGLEALPPHANAAVFLLADQPLITADIVRSLVSAHRKSLASACVPVFEGRRGNPVLFDRVLFPELLELRGDTGGRNLLQKHIESIVTVPSSRAILLDVDTPEDYKLLNSGSDL
jgi:molybdenum cofactor cytidylyltransferase